MSYNLICMSFDGEYKTEAPEFESIEATWEYANDLGSKWFFYPFCFVTTASGKTIAAAPELLERFTGQRTRKVAAVFKQESEKAENENADAEKYAFALAFA